MQSKTSTYSKASKAKKAKQNERKMAKERSDEFEDMFPEIENLKVANLEVDMESINIDEAKVTQNDEWLKSIRKDIYIEEVLAIMKDMIEK